MEHYRYNDIIGIMGCDSFAALLADPNSNLKKLVAKGNTSIVSAGIKALAKGLAKNNMPKLVNLDLSNIIYPSRRGPIIREASYGRQEMDALTAMHSYRAIATVLQHQKSTLEILDLSNNAITDEAAVALFSGLAVINSKLTHQQ